MKKKIGDKLFFLLVIFCLHIVGVAFLGLSSRQLWQEEIFEENLSESSLI